MDGSLKRSPPSSFSSSLSFFSYSSPVQQSHSPDLTYLNPILNFAYLFDGDTRLCTSFARYCRLSKLARGDRSRCIGYLHSPSWSENYVPPRREPHTQMELWIFYRFILPYLPYVFPWTRKWKIVWKKNLFEPVDMRSRCLRLLYVNDSYTLNLFLIYFLIWNFKEI